MSRSSALSLAGLGALCGVFASTGAAQDVWVPPQPPCDVKPGHFRVTSAVVNLRAAAEKPVQRDRMLGQTIDVLTRAIVGDKQDQNPGAWYYLGRYYVEVKDAAGADSAFAKTLALAPQCAADLATHRASLAGGLYTEGLRAWEEGKLDSAVLLLGRSHLALPGNPKPLFSLGSLYSNRDNPDSAVFFLRRGAEVAASDTQFAGERRQALGDVGRIYMTRAQSDPSVERWQRTRFSRDSLERQLASDSSILARIVASSASRRARGARLSPADQPVFARDSTARARAVAEGRSTRTTLAARAGADSAAAQAALAPAIGAYRAYVTAYPAAPEGLANLAPLYGMSGRGSEAAAFFDSLFGQAPDLDPDVVLTAGRLLARGNLLEASARLLGRGLERKPFDRNAVFDRAKVAVALRDSSGAVPLAQRLVALEPLHGESLRLLAAAWDLRGRRDSAAKYYAQADSGLAVDISVTTAETSTPDSVSFDLAILAINRKALPARPIRLTFEFLDRQGAVRATRSMDLPEMPPTSTHQVDLHVSAKDLVGWRYRPT